MILLAVESSCDETSAAVLKNGRIASNIIASQSVHLKYGGVVPELASRAHIVKITSVVEDALQKAETKLEDVEFLAATRGPGLMGSLLVGLTFVKGLALMRNLPFLGVNHLEGHLFSACIEYPELKPPFLSLVVSGGHTMLVRVNDVRDYQILGQTQDDAAGEAFDKVAKILGLPYPGGPAVEKLAAEGNQNFCTFPVARLKNAPLDFSFSGLKTAVLYKFNALSEDEKEKHRADIAAAFQAAVIRALNKNVLKAIEASGLKDVTVVGGVAQNKTLRNYIQKHVEERGCRFFAPRGEYCGDNAAMIAQVAAQIFQKNTFSDLTTPAVPNLGLSF